MRTGWSGRGVSWLIEPPSISRGFVPYRSRFRSWKCYPIVWKTRSKGRCRVHRFASGPFFPANNTSRISSAGDIRTPGSRPSDRCPQRRSITGRPRSPLPGQENRARRCSKPLRRNGLRRVSWCLLHLLVTLSARRSRHPVSRHVSKLPCRATFPNCI